MQLGGQRRNMVGDASDNTRYIRLAAQVAPYLAGTDTAPKPKWSAPSISAEARYAVKIFGSIRASFPNR
jgi:hypothetical protein